MRSRKAAKSLGSGLGNIEDLIEYLKHSRKHSIGTIGEIEGLADCLGRGLHTIGLETLGGGRFPYGLWRHTNGREVLFDSQYRGLWQGLPNGSIEAVTPVFDRGGPDQLGKKLNKKEVRAYRTARDEFLERVVAK
jgi:hypothetical protein